MSARLDSGSEDEDPEDEPRRETGTHMNIVVCVKQVPDTWSEKKLNPTDNTLDRVATDPVMNEMDEYAVEEALKIQEAHGGEVTVLCMGPDAAEWFLVFGARYHRDLHGDRRQREYGQLQFHSDGDHGR